MTKEKGGFGEQALNKIAEIALASQLEEVERLEVQIKTDLNKLAHGEVDSIAININGLVMQQDLAVEELHLQIDRVTVKPLSALLGKIKLTQPTHGTVCIVINEHNLTCAFNSKSFLDYLSHVQAFVNNEPVKIRVQQLKCHLLAGGDIAFHMKLTSVKTGESQIVITATPSISSDGQSISLQNVQYVEGKEISLDLTAALVARMSEILSLRFFEQKGMSLQIQQLDVIVGKLTLQASAYIQQFPTS